MYGSVRCMCEHRTDPYVFENTRRILRSLYVARTGPGDGRECTYEFCLRAFYGKKKRCACTTFRHGLITGIRGLYGLKKPVELRAGPCGPVRYAVRSPTGHWNFGPYGARKLPGSSMWPRHNTQLITRLYCKTTPHLNDIQGRARGTRDQFMTRHSLANRSDHFLSHR